MSQWGDGYSSVRNGYVVEAFGTSTMILKVYFISLHFIQKENLIQENKALSLKLKISIMI